MVSVVQTIFVIGALLLVFEILASALWFPVYFRYGICLFARSIDVRSPDTAADLVSIVDCSTTGFCFRSLSRQEVAFRDPLITFSWTSRHVMRGLLCNYGSKVEVRGFLSWTLILVQFLFLALTGMFILQTPLYGILILIVCGTWFAWACSAQLRRLGDLVEEVTARVN